MTDVLGHIADMQKEQAIAGAMNIPLTYLNAVEAMQPWAVATEDEILRLQRKMHQQLDHLFYLLDYVEHGLQRAVSAAPMSAKQLCDRAAELTLGSGVPLSQTSGENLLYCLITAGAERYLSRHPKIELSLMHRFGLRQDTELVDRLVELINQRYGDILYHSLTGLDAA